ncbi:unnamed protein product [Chironomus riparius]|uniref:[histone H4]-lysine(20) N-methyltransferase n=1 Tax=Chironomus riparius TaxID=315576 RepID=A0A9N9S3X7_9DIPT|nr:unnamed protein product [Chironomus riparius]
MVRGRKPRVQKASTTSPSKKLPTNSLLVNALFEAHDSAFSSPKRKESKIDGVLMENGAGKIVNGKVKPFRPATRSTRKINEYFAKLPANGLIRVQNGHSSPHSHSDDSCDSIQLDSSCEIVEHITENVPPNNIEDHAIQLKQQKLSSNGPILMPEAQLANSNLFLQEPVLKLQFEKSEAVSNVTATTATIKTSFLSTEINTKFQTLPPTEYINKVLNVNGSHDDNNEIVSDEHKLAFLLNSDSNSSDSGVVINGDSDGPDNLLKSPLHLTGKRRKPTTPHRMILCPSTINVAPIVVHHNNHNTTNNNNNKQDAEIIQPARTKSRAKTKLPLSSQDVVHQDHDYDIKKPQEAKPVKTAPPTDNNKKVTEFFTVRRSVRKTKKEVQAERMRNIEQAIFEEREEGLAVKEFPCKGRGIVTTRPFQRGEFVIEYIGDLISMAEANRREKKYAADDNTGCYMYYFKHNDQQYCIDATRETGKLGRLVNHSRNGNLITKTVMIGKDPHLVLIAKDDLPSGVELTYDYGDRSKESLIHHPWLAF